MAALADGVAGLGVASGTSAVFYSSLILPRKGMRSSLPTISMVALALQFNDILPKFGITSKLVDPTTINHVTTITEKTKALFCETVSNPGLDVADLEAIENCIYNGIPLIVDSTFDFYLTRPIEHGASIVIYSLTKWLVNTGNGIGGGGGFRYL